MGWVYKGAHQNEGGSPEAWGGVLLGKPPSGENCRSVWKEGAAAKGGYFPLFPLPPGILHWNSHGVTVCVGGRVPLPVFLMFLSLEGEVCGRDRSFFCQQQRREGTRGWIVRRDNNGSSGVQSFCCKRGVGKGFGVSAQKGRAVRPLC